ncbi:hypothetical protein NM688_g5166 [Phlebia brevispora]|uniref:Uncharacterized protein n=1 Tax=Phlebia brevispora TaxID=194682 RepID=A0ACC1SZA1_9APHY|nr:hypothetical protein NM688_g5166 [Phlebia brevispora]
MPVVVAALFSALRVFALSGGNAYLSGVVLLLGLIPFATNTFVISHLTYSYVDDPILGSICANMYIMPASVQLSCKISIPAQEMNLMTLTLLIVSIVTRASAIIMDMMVLAVTWMKTYNHVKEAWSLGLPVGYSETLLQDGSIYFVALLLFNVAQLLIDVVPALESTGFTPLAVYCEVMPSILISRFIINLRRVQGIDVPDQDNSRAHRLSQFSAPNFRMPTLQSVMDNMGEPLHHDVLAESAGWEDDGELISRAEDVASVNPTMREYGSGLPNAEDGMLPMSDSNDNSAIIAAIKGILVNNYTLFAATALASYEQIVLFEYEYAFLEQHKGSSSTWLFVTNRYLLLASLISSVVPYTPQVRDTMRFVACYVSHPIIQTCLNGPLQTFLFVIQLMPIVVAAVFSALRIFALSGKNPYASGFVLLLGLAPFAVNAYEISQLSYVFHRRSSPWDVLRLQHANFLPNLAFTRMAVSIAARAASIAMDTVVVAVTWMKTYHHVREALSLGVRVGYSETLLQDGSIYFGAMMILNIAQLLTDVVPALQGWTPVSVFCEIMPSILISRFIVNLRRVQDAPTRDISGVRGLSQFSVANFRVPTMQSVVGNMGEPLQHSTITDHTDRNEDRDNISI